MKRIATAALVISSLVLAGCGGSSGDDSGNGSADAPASSGGGSASASGGGSGVTYSTELLSQLTSGTADFPQPPGPFDIGDHHVAIIMSGLSLTGELTVAPILEEAVKASGWSADPPLDGKDTPSVQAGLIEQAVQDHVDAILMAFISPANVSAAVATAQKAGIPIGCLKCGPDDISGIIRSAPSAQTVNDAFLTYMASLLKPDSKVLYFYSDEFADIKELNSTLPADLKQACPGCTFDQVKFTSSDLGTPGTPVFANALQSHPDIDVVFVPYDPVGEVLSQLAAQAGRTEFKIVSQGGNAPMADYIKEGDPTANATVTWPWTYMAGNLVDNVGRQLAGVPTWDTETAPGAVLTKDNYDDLYGDGKYWNAPADYLKTLQQLWGLAG